ncbi:MAG: RCC1 domain-containing protein [Gemmatimonadaceae bacterium]
MKIPFEKAGPFSLPAASASFFPVIAGLALIACGQPENGPTSLAPRTDAVTVSPAALVQSVALDYSTPLLVRGQTLQLKATLINAAGEVLNPRAIQWTSADPSVVQVRADGLTGDLTAVAPGTTTITGTIEGVSATSVVTVVAFASISSGQFVSCAITTEGKLYCAGSGYGPEAQLVAPAIRFSKVSAFGGFGNSEVCALAIDRSAYCWGTTNTSGQLGVGDLLARSTPTPVAGGISFTSVSVGRDYACGLATSGVAYCWGNGSTGQLGTGTTTNNSVPVQVAGGLKFAQLEAGNGTTCGLTGSGKAYCWGRNELGQLGVGPSGSIGNQALVPVPVGEPLATVALKQIVTRAAKACALTLAGKAYCWGNNTVGEVGAVTTEICPGEKPCSTSPVPVQTTAVFSSLAASMFAACGVTSTGETLCWGMDFERLFGSSPQDQVRKCDTFGAPNGCTVVPVEGPSGMLNVSGTYANYCGMRSNGVTYCWGGNDFGQRGWGDATPDPTPRPFSIAPGAAH